ncbi:MAG: hypothetical protein JNK81_13000 [Anaerolineales bacterium]|nr:hypothetical protein [Anaerolineales bacterium]
MNELFTNFFRVLLLTISLTSYFLVINALFTNRVSKTQNIIHQTAGRSFGLGLVNALFFGAIGLFLLMLLDGNRVPDLLRVILIFPTFIVWAFLFSLMSIGLTSMVKNLSEKIFPDLTSWKQIVWGSVVLCFACALPFVGWFLLIPFILFISIGAAILGIVQKS